MKRPIYYYDGEGLTQIRQWIGEKGILHRWGGPAVENPNGTKIWITHGMVLYEDSVVVGRVKHPRPNRWQTIPIPYTHPDPMMKEFKVPGYEEARG